MPTDVTVTDDGKLVAIVDGVHGLPMTVETVQALADRIPDAQNAAARVALTVSVKALVDAFTVAPESLDAQVHVTSQALVAKVDADTFASMQTQMNVQPDQDGALRKGPIEVWPPEPEPESAPEPEPEP